MDKLKTLNVGELDVKNKDIVRTLLHCLYLKGLKSCLLGCLLWVDYRVIIRSTHTFCYLLLSPSVNNILPYYCSGGRRRDNNIIFKKMIQFWIKTKLKPFADQSVLRCQKRHKASKVDTLLKYLTRVC